MIHDELRKEEGGDMRPRAIFGTERPVWELGRVWTSIYGDTYVAALHRGLKVWHWQTTLDRYYASTQTA
jgi:hypothetical protein